jgi:hypothetical protein
LEYLGKKAVGQTASHNQQVDIEQAIDEVYSDLQTDNLLTFSTTGDIPNNVLPHIKHLVAMRRSSGLSDERYQRILMDAGDAGWKAKREIRRVISQSHNPIDTADDF